MKTKFACADFTFPLLSHDQSLQLISLLDFTGVDIGLFEERSHLWPSREFKNVSRSARALRKKLDGLGLKPADIFLQMAPDFTAFAVNHPKSQRRRKARDWFLRTLDYTAECGGRHITILPGVHFEVETQADSLDRCADELAWRMAQAKKHRLVVSVEAHVGSIAPRPSLAAALIKRVPGLTLTLDYTHFTRIGLPDSSVEPLVKHASHFHVRGARRGRLQERFTHNTIDYARVFKTMQKSNYKGWIGIEFVWQDWEHCNECDNLSETILFRDFFRKMAG
ncbi:MAG: sugar phosphate isomerase/epimerase [Candidatus Handelsmanbacteria bacterium]|nr:sugar phosphate isomerase/epimerase [Candidatus Handelsmanbacteria bacterium]